MPSLQVNGKLQASIRSNHEQLDMAIGRINALTKDHKALRDTISDLTASLREAREQRAMLSAGFDERLRELEDLGAAHEEACTKAAGLQAELEHAARERADLGRAITDLHRQLQTKDKEMSALKEAQASLAARGRGGADGCWLKPLRISLTPVQNPSALSWPSFPLLSTGQRGGIGRRACQSAG